MARLLLPLNSWSDLAVPVASAAVIVMLFFPPRDPVLHRAWAWLRRNSVEKAPANETVAAVPSTTAAVPSTTAAVPSTTPEPLPSPPPPPPPASLEGRLVKEISPIDGSLAMPHSLLTAELLAVLEGSFVIPGALEGRVLQSVYNSRRHGFTMAALRRKCFEVQRPSLEQPCLLLVKVGAKTTLGCYLTEFPEWNTKGSRFFTGSCGTCVFRFTAAADGDGAAAGPQLSFHRGLDTEDDGTSNAPRGNGRFFRADDDELMMGVGPEGAAMRLKRNLTSVVCAGPSETFEGLKVPLLPFDASPRCEVDRTGSGGVSVTAPVNEVELLLFTEDVAR